MPSYDVTGGSMLLKCRFIQYFGGKGKSQLKNKQSRGVTRLGEWVIVCFEQLHEIY
jgi:hypothetical protein